LIWRPFEVGDRIQIGDTAGDVINLNIFQLTVNEIGGWVDSDQSTGRLIHVPNALVFSNRQANFTQGFDYIWNEIPVVVTFETNWEKAKKILTDIINEHSKGINLEARKELKKASKKYLLVYRKLTPKVYTDVKDSGICLTIRYLCSPYKRRGSTEAIWEKILKQFQLNSDIDLAYPTVRYYDNRTEGKPPYTVLPKPKSNEEDTAV